MTINTQLTQKFVMLTLIFSSLVFVVLSLEDQSFPPPPMPVMPEGFNIYCDVCQSMVKRMIPYCQRVDQNLDYLPDFCTFNYNQVLNTECNYLVDVAEYAWCPNACEQLRRVQSFGTNICKHSMVNCTERDFVPSPTPSPSPSPSASVAPDCVLCGNILGNLALLCMNQELVNQRTTYETCMTQTTSREYFGHCVTFLNEVVEIAGSRDPCTLLQCGEPELTCSMTSNGCHVTRFNASNGGVSSFSVNYTTTPHSQFATTKGLGPGDFRPGQKPYNSDIPLVPHITSQDRISGSAFTPYNSSEPTTPEGIKEKEDREAALAEEKNKNAAAAPIPTPVPLRDIKHQ
eukprot:c4553_g1_i1.p1 GENE.c4553_g1_i1~~c4553_g1_i1.p1  ORF type:complete len:345 (+),score=131.56 c4553_g1_i1:64-1098(+)